MSTALLGEEFDIHGGGLDLEFPHHENEIAQSEAASGKGFARYWMHNGLVRVSGEKMSKSLGNFLTIRDALRRFRGEEIRYFIVASHYRSPLELNDDSLPAARAALRRLYTALRDRDPAAEGTSDPAYVERFVAAMDDDLNTSAAIAVLHELAGALNREEGDGERVPDAGDDAPRARRTARSLAGRSRARAEGGRRRGGGRGRCPGRCRDRRPDRGAAAGAGGEGLRPWRPHP